MRAELFSVAFLLLWLGLSEGRVVSFYLLEELGFFVSSSFEVCLFSTGC
jgi:hypothetical protein